MNCTVCFNETMSGCLCININDILLKSVHSYVRLHLHHRQRRATWLQLWPRAERHPLYRSTHANRQFDAILPGSATNSSPGLGKKFLFFSFPRKTSQNKFQKKRNFCRALSFARVNFRWLPKLAQRKLAFVSFQKPRRQRLVWLCWAERVSSRGLKMRQMKIYAQAINASRNRVGDKGIDIFWVKL